MLKKTYNLIIIILAIYSLFYLGYSINHSNHTIENLHRLYKCIMQQKETKFHTEKTDFIKFSEKD